jgi:hypothetical protein
MYTGGSAGGSTYGHTGSSALDASEEPPLTAGFWSCITRDIRQLDAWHDMLASLAELYKTPSLADSPEKLLEVIDAKEQLTTKYEMGLLTTAQKLSGIMYHKGIIDNFKVLYDDARRCSELEYAIDTEHEDRVQTGGKRQDGNGCNRLTKQEFRNIEDKTLKRMRDEEDNEV